MQMLVCVMDMHVRVLECESKDKLKCAWGAEEGLLAENNATPLMPGGVERKRDFKEETGSLLHCGVYHNDLHREETQGAGTPQNT